MQNTQQVGAAATIDGMVTVVVPHFNREDVVGRAIRSALQQTYSNLEVVVVDDGSAKRDKIEEVLASFDDGRLRLIRHSANRNGAAARNTGVRNARGEFVAFLDSDDEWMSEKIERQVTAHRNAGDDKLIVYCQSDVRGAGNRAVMPKIWPTKGIDNGELVSDYLFCRGGFMPTPSIFLKRDLALSTPFNESLKRHQDYDLLLRLEAAGARFHMVNEALVIVHWEDLHSASRQVVPQQTIGFADTYRQYLSDCARSRLVFQQVIMVLLRSGDRRAAVGHLFSSRIRWRYFHLLDWICLLSWLALRDDRIVRAMVVAKRFFWRSLNVTSSGADATRT